MKLILIILHRLKMNIIVFTMEQNWKTINYHYFVRTYLMINHQWSLPLISIQPISQHNTLYTMVLVTRSHRHSNRCLRTVMNVHGEKIGTTLICDPKGSYREQTHQKFLLHSPIKIINSFITNNICKHRKRKTIWIKTPKK